MVVIYPAFLLGLPLTLVFPLYPALLLIPAWRNRSNGVGKVLIDHLVFGAGVLAEVMLRLDFDVSMRPESRGAGESGYP